MKLDIETAKTLTIIIGVSFSFIAIAWIFTLAILLVTWFGGII